MIFSFQDRQLNGTRSATFNQQLNDEIAIRKGSQHRADGSQRDGDAKSRVRV